MEGKTGEPVEDEQKKEGEGKAHNSQEPSFVTSFRPMFPAKAKSLPVPGIAGPSSSTSDVDGTEHADDYDDPLTCREKLPSPTSSYLAEDDTPSPETIGSEDGKVVKETIDAPHSSVAFLLKAPSQSSAATKLKSSTQVVEFPPRRSRRSPVPKRLPGSSPEKPVAKRRLRRPLPTASSRQAVSMRGRPQKKHSLSTGSSDSESNEQPAKSPKSKQQKTIYAPDALLSSTSQLSYSWDSLGLGKTLGSAALNDFVRRMRKIEGNDMYHQDLTPQEMLQIINSMRVKTCLPPPGSALHRIIQKNRFENREELYGSDKKGELMMIDDEKMMALGSESLLGREQATGQSAHHQEDPLPFKTLARLYETMCAQDTDDGSSNRREAQYLSASAVVEKLQGLENTACELKLKEEQVIKAGRELGLVDHSRSVVPSYASVEDYDDMMKTYAKLRHMLTEKKP